MSTPEQNLPAAEVHRNEGTNTSHDPATQQQSELRQADNGDAAPPPLPSRPASIRPQPLPQPFYGQSQPVYVPYTGQPNQQYTYATPVRPVPKLSSAWLAARIGLTVLSSIWGIIIIALTSILLSQGSTVGSVSLYSYAIVIASILWNSAELITYCVRLRKQIQRGIHPGAHVGLHLIFWLIGAFAILLSVSVYESVEYGVRRCERQDDEDSDYSSYYSYYCDEYKPLDYFKSSVIPVLQALVAIFILWAINHFILFVLACIETHKRNALKPAAFVVPVVAPNAAVPTQAMYYPQQAGTQPMQPVQYYPYPIMMQPQSAHLAGAESRAPVSNEKQPAQVDQNLAGFYAPAAGPSAQALPNNISTASPAQNA
ncbi:hypothetical protein F5Y10DRAFT_245691 [Nemania abortiva]|nr:hypothetical protein F5Y10DRAFT_245691 [Nemania abortiva]